MKYVVLKKWIVFLVVCKITIAIFFENFLVKRIAVHYFLSLQWHQETPGGEKPDRGRLENETKIKG
jgi:hypothetical protein